MADVGVRRGQSWLLHNVNWTVDDVDRWVVVGPNGAGKTTALSIAATRMFPTMGTVSILGERMGQVDIADLRPRVGFASSSLLRDIPMHEKAADVVMTSAYGVTGRWREAYEAQDRARAHSLLNDWGASSFAERPFASLSEGERKRVLIARALMSDPELLLLDESGAGLDLAGREELVGMLATFAHKPDSPTLVLVTHHLEEIPPGITHALLLGQGQMVAAGPLDQTLTNQLLSRTFGMNFDVRRIGERWSAVTSQS